MTVKEVLEKFKNLNQTVKVVGYNLKLIAEDTPNNLMKNDNINLERDASYGFFFNVLHIFIAETVYEVVQRMTKKEFGKFCHQLYAKGWNDSNDCEDDESWIMHKLADCSMNVWEEHYND